jgi:exodeoxyribonuclease-3
MLLASWNVNSISVRLPQVLAWLKETNPDVLCLQETKTVDDKFPLEAFHRAGYQCEIFGERTYNGVALVSRLPMTNVQKGFIDEQAPGAKRFIEAFVGPTYILNVYIPNGQAVGSDKYEYKLKWLQSLKNHLETRHNPNNELVMCGDFNIAPEDRDVYKPEDVVGTIMCSEAERIALQSIANWGLADAFRLHNPSSSEFTWWDYRMGAFRRNLGFRIDHIWATKKAANSCKRSWIDRAPRKQERPSDHAPLLAEFAF